jgi:hypothetical protein
VFEAFAIFDALVLRTGFCFSSVNGLERIVFGEESDCARLDDIFEVCPFSDF